MSSVTSRMTERPSGSRCTSTVAEPGRAHLGQLQVAQRQPGELGRVVPEHLGGGLAPVVALQQGGQVVGLAPGGQSRTFPPSSERAASAARSSSWRFSVRAASRAASSVREPSGEPLSGFRTGVSGATPVVVGMSVDATAT